VGGRTRFAGQTRTEQTARVVLAIETSKDRYMASTPGQQAEQFWLRTEQVCTVAREVDDALQEAMCEQSQRRKDESIPAGAAFARPNQDPSKVDRIGLKSDGYEVPVHCAAGAAHLPPSMLVRSWILHRLESEPAPHPSVP
jgi:hypothetical protein